MEICFGFVLHAYICTNHAGSLALSLQLTDAAPPKQPPNLNMIQYPACSSPPDRVPQPLCV